MNGTILNWNVITVVVFFACALLTRGKFDIPIISREAFSERLNSECWRVLGIHCQRLSGAFLIEEKLQLVERIEVANAVATQATVQTRACGLGAKKLASDSQQIIQG